MRQLLAAMAIVAFAGAASAQYKTPAPAGTPAVPVTANPNVQITPASPTEAQDNARRIPRDEAMKMVKEHKAVYVDVRPKDQYDIEHIEGSINIPLAEVTARANELPKNKFIVTYCA